MHPSKAPHVAADIARKAGFPLRIAAKMREPEERAYFETMVRPLLGADVSYIGEVDHQTKIDLLSEAECLLNPIAWAEPFGMVMIEALACGTPVLTSTCGAAPEIVEDGVVGFVRSDKAGLVQALAHVHEIERKTCRERVATVFSAQRMVEAHVDMYERAVAGTAGRPLEVIMSGAA
jgi:glycosyltransferase involved in cell wall biosynthesis